MLSLISLHENNFFGIMSFLQGQKKKKKWFRSNKSESRLRWGVRLLLILSPDTLQNRGSTWSPFFFLSDHTHLAFNQQKFLFKVFVLVFGFHYLLWKPLRYSEATRIFLLQSTCPHLKASGYSIGIIVAENSQRRLQARIIWSGLWRKKEGRKIFQREE